MDTLGLAPTVLLLQEIQCVTSAMRRNQRWASTAGSSAYPSGPNSSRLFVHGRRERSGQGDEDEGDLMLGFVELRRAVYDANGTSWAHSSC